MKTLLLPGLDGTGALFGPFLRELDPSLGPTVISYPLDAVALPAIELPRGEPFALLAESYSGAAALHIAAAQPPGLVAIVLVASFVSSPLRWLPSALVRPWLLGPMARSRMLNRRQLLDAASPAALIDWVTETIAQVPPATLAARVRRVLTLDARDALAAGKAPVLYLQATRDRIVSERSVNEIRAGRPDVIVERIEGPHLLLQCNPSAGARAVERFLEPRKKIDPSVAGC
jgi:pimeloyl-ACP methyl ester carboxylesterase